MGAVVAAHPIEVPVETGDVWHDLKQPYGYDPKRKQHVYRAQSSLAAPCSHQLGQRQAAVASLVVANYLLALLDHAFCMCAALHVLAALTARALTSGIHTLHATLKASLARAHAALTRRTPPFLTALLSHWLAPLAAGLLLIHPRTLAAAAPPLALLYALLAAASMPHHIQDLSVLPAKVSVLATTSAAATAAALHHLDLLPHALPPVLLLLRAAAAATICQLYLVLYRFYHHQQACSWVLLKLLLLTAAAPHPAWSWRALALTEKLRLLTQLQFHAPPTPPAHRHPTCLLLQRLSRLLLAACLALAPPGDLPAASFVPRAVIAAVPYALLTLALGCAASWVAAMLLRPADAAPTEAAAAGKLPPPAAPQLACSWRWATSAAAVVVLVAPTLAAAGGEDEEGGAHRWAVGAMRVLSVADMALAGVATLRGLGSRPRVA